ncbi:MAG: MBL fold metallo-hydrolase [Candidatus Krumholzibacteria bacterium]|nr:MBL fold metallo-hydrolase [Candidatus Krumholzibacteria bacterium]
MSAKVKFFGAVRTVTGSMHMITNGRSRFIVDCGLFQGRRDESFERNTHFPLDPRELQACVLSHAHIDHSGNLPSLVKRGFRGRILATEATRDLCTEMLPDSGHIQEEDIRFVNKILKKRGLPPRLPLYTLKDSEEALRFFRGCKYRTPVQIEDGVTVTFYDAGHVLGSATPLIEMHNGTAPIRLAYAVDLGRKNAPILRDPERPPDIDYLILESTYGGRTHSPIEEAEEMLARTVRATAERGGKIIIPSFALERTQEIVYYLSRLIKQNRIPDLPIYVDSPLAVNITDVFRKHEECFDEETLSRLRANSDPFGTERIRYITDVADSKKLNGDARPMIIISASGMCEAGRILHHLRNNIENPKNTILIVGFVAKNTLGRRIVERAPTVRIFGEEQPLRAEVVIINAFSAHADRNELLDYVMPLKGRVKAIFIVHGDEDQSESLTALLKEQGFAVHMPFPEEEIELA